MNVWHKRCRVVSIIRLKDTWVDVSIIECEKKSQWNEQENNSSVIEQIGDKHVKCC